MRQYEFKFVAQTGNAGVSREELEPLGEDGWQVVSVAWTATRIGPVMAAVFLQREVRHRSGSLVDDPDGGGGSW